MARRGSYTDAQIEMEIHRLQQSDDVKLAQKEQRIKNRRRQQMYCLQYLEKRGKQLRSMGITPENIESVLFGDDSEDTD